MRRAFQVVATIFLVSMILGALLMVQINFGWVTKVDAMRADPVTRFIVDGARSDIPASSAFEQAAWLWLVLGIGTLLAIVAVFMRKRLFGILSATILIAFASITVLLQPSISNINGNNPQTTGMGIAFFGILGLLILVLLHTTFKTDNLEPKSNRLY
jgi:hypothetical protein